MESEVLAGKRASSYAGVVQLQRISEVKLSFARMYRKNMTRAEALLWSRLRGKKCDGFKFRRQQIIDGFIADFFCAETNLVVEADGEVHDYSEQQEIDAHRQRVFAIRGVKVLRFRNEDIMRNYRKRYRENRKFLRAIS